MTDMLFINDTAIVCKTTEDIKETSQQLFNHLTEFSLPMHTGMKQKQKMKQRTSQYSNRGANKPIQTYSIHATKQWTQQNSLH